MSGTFTWKPAMGAKCTTKPVLLNPKFGDGYELIVEDGINNMPRSWSVSFSKLEAEIDDIENFLRATRGASAFTWKPPSGVVGTFICESWERGIDGPFVHTLSGTFREVFI